MQGAVGIWKQATWPYSLYQLHHVGANLQGEMFLNLWGGGAPNTSIRMIRETINSALSGLHLLL